MFVESVTLYNYRNLTDQTINFVPGVNFIVGRNGHGKTNIVEAICLLSRSKSFRTSKSAELIKWGYKEASVFSRVCSGGDISILGISLANKSREFFLNHDKIKSFKEIVGKLLTVTFSPIDIALIKGGPNERRSFLDKSITDTDIKYLDHLMSYQRALKNKNIILKRGLGNLELLDPWNSIMAEACFHIALARRKFVHEIQEKSSVLYQKLSSRPQEVNLKIKSNFIKNNSDISVESILNVLKESRAREASIGTSLVGTHRDELLINIDNSDSRAFASQGESKSLVLSLKLASIELIEEKRKESPVVLLDDVDSELDSSRREAFLELIFSRSRQVMITGTEISPQHLMTNSNYQILKMADGSLEKSS